MLPDVAVQRVLANACTVPRRGNIRPDAALPGLGLALKESDTARFAAAAQR